MKPINQSGAIVYKFKNDRPCVMIVSAKRNPGHRIFPKGHYEEGETGEQAAARELLEEAGIEGTILRFLSELSYEVDGRRYRVGYYLLRYASSKSDGERGRAPCWCTIEEALSLLTFSDTRELLKASVQFMIE